MLIRSRCPLPPGYRMHKCTLSHWSPSRMQCCRGKDLWSVTVTILAPRTPRQGPYASKRTLCAFMCTYRLERPGRELPFFWNQRVEDFALPIWTSVRMLVASSLLRFECPLRSRRHSATAHQSGWQVTAYPWRCVPLANKSTRYGARARHSVV